MLKTRYVICLHVVFLLFAGKEVDASITNDLNILEHIISSEYQVASQKDLRRSEIYALDSGDLKLTYWNTYFLDRTLNRTKKFATTISNDHQIVTAEGRTYYMGLFPRQFRYHASYSESNQATIYVRIHFQDLDLFTPNEVALLDKKLKMASQFWNDAAIKYGLSSRFSFLRSQFAAESDFSVQLFRDWVRGPYDRNWGLKWSSRNVSHEVGHMLGLDDEYNQWRSTFHFGRTASNRGRCNRNSIMCTSISSDVLPYHFKIILSRLL